MRENNNETNGVFPRIAGAREPQSLRVAIKVKGKILFINLDGVVSVQSNGRHVAFHQTSGSHLLRESISAVAERLETHGFIRINRSVLVNTLFVEQIWPVSTGTYCLRVVDGKEFTVTRSYKKNLQFLADCWIGTGAPLEFRFEGSRTVKRASVTME